MVGGHGGADGGRICCAVMAALAREPSVGPAEALRRSMMTMLDPSKKAVRQSPSMAPFVLADEGRGAK